VGKNESLTVTTVTHTFAIISAARTPVSGLNTRAAAAKGSPRSQDILAGACAGVLDGVSVIAWGEGAGWELGREDGGREEEEEEMGLERGGEHDGIQ
jgi:hypothetical protein